MYARFVSEFFLLNWIPKQYPLSWRWYRDKVLQWHLAEGWRIFYYGVWFFRSLPSVEMISRRQEYQYLKWDFTSRVSDWWRHLRKHLGINANNYFMFWLEGPVCSLPPLYSSSDSSCISTKPVYSASSATWLTLMPVCSDMASRVLLISGWWQKEWVFSHSYRV